jgi:hypothetical protein
MAAMIPYTPQLLTVAMTSSSQGVTDGTMGSRPSSWDVAHPDFIAAVADGVVERQSQA